MKYYKDLREYIAFLQSKGQLVTIHREINKDTELQPLVRCQFHGLQETERKAFLFDNCTDVQGRKYNGRVLAGAHAASTQIYAYAMNCRPEQIPEKWEKARRRPIRTRRVESGPVQEEIHMGDGLLAHGGLEEFPIPIATPGFDNAPYFSAGNWISKDPDTGIYNMGNYRGMVKSPVKVGCDNLLPQHLRTHREKYKKKGAATMPAAVVIGPTPNVGLVAVAKLPYGVSELDVAGAIAGAPLEMVRCQTIDLEVPANAEIVIEGEIPTDILEREGPFGEYTGYIGRAKMNLLLNVTAITHRKNPIWNIFISQCPPSESSLMTRLGLENIFYNFLKHDLSVTNLRAVGFHEKGGGRQFCVISLEKPNQGDVWRTLNGAASLAPIHAKIIIVVDEDIDPRDMGSVVWALCFRMQPHRDLRVSPGKATSLDPSIVPPADIKGNTENPYGSALLIDATRKWDYYPVSLPKKEYMEHAARIWAEEGLPALNFKEPWFGYNLGFWNAEDEKEAELALKGQHYQTGEKIAKNQIKG
ncbi:MAG: UbiD family decarboxylase [Desulfobacterales bacterium]|nr:UbiD family decarboxylase [Desulfobacterales bacterium]